MEYLLICGDSLEKLKDLDENSVDSIVTDPPYHLKSSKDSTKGFMGKDWDGGDIAFKKELWQEALRVLKPGGHLLAFSGTRTVHRMVCAIEDAGFEIRDMMTWNYSTGFPKSLDISKAIDKKFGAEREVVGKGNIRGSNGIADGNNGAGKYGFNCGEAINITAPATPQAKQWNGWGTALKPSIEPICVARKPLSEKTVAENVLKWGVGGLNIDGCRVGSEVISTHNAPKGTFAGGEQDRASDTNSYKEHTGRWPANFIHSGCEEVVSLFPYQKSGGGNKNSKNSKAFFGNMESSSEYDSNFEPSKGSASRFFYCAKASKKDRNEGLDGFELKVNGVGALRDNGRESQPRANNHPTVKPTDLMAYLVRLVTPPNGTVLDPFNGSGSTGKACMRENFNYIGIDLSQEYLDISKARIEYELSKKTNNPE